MSFFYFLSKFLLHLGFVWNPISIHFLTILGYYQDLKGVTQSNWKNFYLAYALNCGILTSNNLRTAQVMERVDEWQGSSNWKSTMLTGSKNPESDEWYDCTAKLSIPYIMRNYNFTDWMSNSSIIKILDQSFKTWQLNGSLFRVFTQRIT